jgi:hypothetical protein
MLSNPSVKIAFVLTAIAALTTSMACSNDTNERACGSVDDCFVGEVCIDNLCVSDPSLDAGGDTSDSGDDAQSSDTASPDGDATTSPDITAMTLDPSQIPASETGMTDQNFTVTIEIDGATTAPSSVEVYLQTNDGPRSSFGDTVSSTAEEVVVEAPYTWAQNLEPGEYPVGAELAFPDEDPVAAQDLTTLELTP